MSQTLVINGAVMGCCGQPRSACRCGGVSLTRNAPPAAQDPAEASKLAAAGTAILASGRTRQAAMRAVDAARDGRGDDAAEAHQQAAEGHDNASVDARRDGDPSAGDQHDAAAALHRKAASMHEAGLTDNRRHQSDRTTSNRSQTVSREPTFNYGGGIDPWDILPLPGSTQQPRTQVRNAGGGQIEGYLSPENYRQMLVMNGAGQYLSGDLMLSEEHQDNLARKQLALDEAAEAGADLPGEPLSSTGLTSNGRGFYVGDCLELPTMNFGAEDDEEEDDEDEKKLRRENARRMGLARNTAGGLDADDILALPHMEW